jgi:hypothetical protein
MKVIKITIILLRFGVIFVQIDRQNLYKMKPAVLIFLLLTFSSSFIGCRKEKETLSTQIVGKWEWIKSVSPRTGQVSDPKTEGYSATLEFTKDGIMKEYRNSTLSVSTNYNLEAGSYDSDITYINYGTGLSSQIYIGHDTLTLNNAFVDGPVSSYSRLQ